MASPIPQRIPFLIGPALLPGVPTLTGVTAYDSGAVASWTAPASDGGSPVLGYLVTATVVADGTVAATVTTAASDTSASLTTLTNGIQYTVTVAALTGIGSSATSSGLTVTPLAGLQPLTPTPGPAPVPVHQTVAQPILEAFPVDMAFRPENWLRSPQEVAP